MIAITFQRAVWMSTLLCASAVAQEQASNFAVACKEYIDKKGYSTDYIEAKTGKRQPGPATRWKGNIELAELQVGDVVFSHLRQGSNMQRVALVDEVIPGPDGKAAAVIISEWNYGKRFNDKDCFVTDKFGVPSSTREPVSALLRAWRPSLPLP